VAPVAKTTFEAVLVIDDPSKFDLEAYKKSIASTTNVDLSKVEVTKVEFSVTVGLKFTGTVTAEQAKKALSASLDVAEDAIEVKIVGRRLAAAARGLQAEETSVEAIIKTEDAGKAGEVISSSSNAEAIATAMRDQGAEIGPVTVTPATTSIKIFTAVSSDSAEAVEAPKAEDLQSELKKEGVEVTVALQNVEMEVPEDEEEDASSRQSAIMAALSLFLLTHTLA